MLIPGEKCRPIPCAGLNLTAYYVDQELTNFLSGTMLAISPNCRVGNGGLSLRNRKAMLKITEEFEGDPIPNPSVIFTEDLYFSINMQSCNLQNPGTFKIPDVETASKFSVESIYSPSPIGLHKTWKYLPPKLVESLLASIDYG